jgi:hypothetical protein
MCVNQQQQHYMGMEKIGGVSFAVQLHALFKDEA